MYIPPLLSLYARQKKINYFLTRIPKYYRILEIGCGDGWVRKYLEKNGWKNYVGLDIVPPADIIGDIRDWKLLGIKDGSFDIIIAFEVMEHIGCFKECYEILKPDGQLMLTTPLPHMDWIMKILEWLNLNQKRTSPHEHLVYLKDVPYFEKKECKVVAFLSQWGTFTKEKS